MSLTKREPYESADSWMYRESLAVVRSIASGIIPNGWEVLDIKYRTVQRFHDSPPSVEVAEVAAFNEHYLWSVRIQADESGRPFTR